MGGHQGSYTILQGWSMVLRAPDPVEGFIWLERTVRTSLCLFFPSILSPKNAVHLRVFHFLGRSDPLFLFLGLTVQFSVLQSSIGD